MYRTVLTSVGVCAIVCLFGVSCFAIEVSTVAGLQSAVAGANGGGDKNIVLRPGTYSLGGTYFRLTADNITIAGKTGKRGDVILDGGYATTEIFQVLASHVTIKNLTLKHAKYHPVHVFPQNDGDVVGTRIVNVHIIDPGQQAIKINQNGAKTRSANFGSVEGSRIELTDSGRAMVWQINGSCYTGGVDAHHATGWSVTDNVIVGFWCNGGLSEHGVHFWSESKDTLVERNKIVNCDRGIGFGLGSSGHIGGTIRNNMIYHDSGHAYSDVGISLENATGAMVYNNTIYHEHDYPNAIEYRFGGTNGGIVKNNLANRAVVSRNGGAADLSHNVTAAQASWFRDGGAGDLHLSRRIGGVVDAGTMIAGLEEDFDKEARPGAIDIGADEWLGVAGGETRPLPCLMLLSE